MPGQPCLLFVDDDPSVLAGLKMVVRRHYEVHTATSGPDALAILAQRGDIAVIVSDMQMPEMNGAQLLAQAKEKSPDTARILLTGQADIGDAIAAINKGQIFRFLVKPCPPDQLTHVIEQAVENYQLIVSRRELLEQTLVGAVRALRDVLHLADPVAFGLGEQMARLATKVGKKLGHTVTWRLETAALFCQLGNVSMPEEVRNLLNSSQVNKFPQIKHFFLNSDPMGAEILEHIPHLDQVAELIRLQEKPPEKIVSEEARILAMVKHYVVERRFATDSAAALVALNQKASWGKKFISALMDVVKESTMRLRVEEMYLSQLKPGMILAEDLIGPNGALLLTAGTEMNDRLISHLRQVPDKDLVKQLKIWSQQ